MVAEQDGGLVINGFNAWMTSPDPSGGWMAQASSDGTTWGDPEAVINKLSTQLADGDLESVDRFGNREATIFIRFTAPDSSAPGADIATGQQALETACRFTGWAPLEWTSTLAGAPTTVMEMTSATVSKNLDTLAEQLRGERTVSVTIHARPFARPETQVSIDAPASVGSTTTSVDDGSVTTNWSLLSTAPAAFHNLNSNPSFETNTTGWSAGPSGTASISRGTGSFYVGSASLAVSESSTSGRSYVTSPVHTVTAGTAYYVTLAFQGSPSGGSTGGAVVKWYSDASATVQVGSDWTTTWSGTSSWGVKTFTTPAAPATAIRMKALPFADSSSFLGGPSLWNLDAVLVTEAGTGYTPSYFDGATTATTALTYAWSGTANLSTTTATWTSPTLAVVSGAVKGTVYGRSSASIRRTGTVTMSSLKYMRLRGTASAYSDGQVTIADNGGAAITPISYSYNQTTGAYDIIINRPAGFAAIDITFSRTGGSISGTTGLFVASDQIDITDNPFASGKAQTRQVTIYGSQRTELSLTVLGLDAAGTTPVAIGERVLVHTAAAGTDSRAKFVGCRATSALAGTSDSTAVSGAYNTLNTTGTPTSFTFPAATLLPGEYLVYTRLKGTSATTRTISYAAALDGAGSLDMSDPASGWYTTTLSVLTTYNIFPLGKLTLPPAGIEDASATLTIKVAASTASVVNLDEIWLAHDATGRVTLLDTNDSGISAVRLDAATVAAPQPSAWVGVATATGTGAMMFAGGRILSFDQHMAEPGLLQISTVTPGCATTRVSALYYPRYAHDVAPLPS